MQYIIIARDGTDPDAGDRRQAARPAHYEGATKLQHRGNMLLGGSLLDDGGNMIGSVAVCQFASRAELDEWLANDPYVTGGVWQDIQILPYRIAPHYDIPKCPGEDAPG
jgi:uncharacterized protein